MRNSLLILANLVLLLSVSEACHRKAQGLFDDKPAQGEVHHHHYNSGPALPHPEALHSPEPIFGPEGPEEPAKHVVVLQTAPPPQPENDLFNLFPKKLHPKHFFKGHIHKLRSKFRDLFFDSEGASPNGHGHGHGHGHHHKRPISPSRPQYHPEKVAIPALKVPLIQVEAYKAAPYPGFKGHAHAYVSPDGYQPAVVVKSKAHPPHHHHVHHPHPDEVEPHGPTHGPTHGPPPPHPQHYAASPSPVEAYHHEHEPTPQPHPHYSQHHHHSPTYPQAQPPAYQHQHHHSYPTQPAYVPHGPPPPPPGPPSSPYGPHGYQSSQPLYEPQQPRGQFPSSSFLGQSSSSPSGFGSPFSSSFGTSSHYH